MFKHKYTLKGLKEDLEFTTWRIGLLQANAKVDPNYDVPLFPVGVAIRDYE